MHHLYHIFYPLIDVSAMFKTLAPDEAENIINEYSEMSKRDYLQLVVKVCITNFKSEIVPALKNMTTFSADEMMINLYNGCIMLNPGLDLATWLTLTQSYNVLTEHTADESSMTQTTMAPGTMKELVAGKKNKDFSISLAKYLNLESHLNDRVIGQKEAVAQICSAMKRAQAHLNDSERPIGVFLFAGPSGVGKSLIAEALQEYLFDKTPLVRVDCGEYQHKHENQKLIGSASGYVGYEDGGQLTKSVAANPHTVVLIDEVEKAHPDIWNTFLKIFDKGFLTDNKGNNVSFKNTIIVMTSNLGNDSIAADSFGRKTGFNNKVGDNYSSREIPSRELISNKTNEAIRKYFKPELINRLDETIIFNYLTKDDYRKIAELEMMIVSEKLAKRQFKIQWNEDALDLLGELSGSTIQGARGMSMTRRKKIEDPLADIIINTKYPRGTMFNVTVQNDQFVIS